MKRVLGLLTIAAFALAPQAAYAASIGFNEVAASIDGTLKDSITNGTPLALGGIDDSAFDYGTGFGTLSFTITGAGAHQAIAFYDFDIFGDAPGSDLYYDDTGAALGSPAPGMNWEIDEPGYTFGDIYSNVVAGTLDNTVFDGSITNEDVSLALSWDFVLNAGDTATVRFITSLADPMGFRLQQTDASGQTVYLTSTLDVTPGGPAPVPEPASIVLLGTGVLAVARRRWRGRPQA
jgi:hypothetical protein